MNFTSEFYAEAKMDKRKLDSKSFNTLQLKLSYYFYSNEDLDNLLKKIIHLSMFGNIQSSLVRMYAKPWHAVIIEIICKKRIGPK